MTRPDHREIPGYWNAYVAAGKDRAERAQRLNECPDAFRAAVESHVRLVFALRGQAGLRREMNDLKGPAGGSAFNAGKQQEHRDRVMFREERVAGA